jgi:hypothetical protein
MQTDLKDRLRDCPLSDSDAAALLSAEVREPRAGRVTFATIAALWGFDRAIAFRATVKAGAASASALAPKLEGLLALIDGPGFDPAHPDAITTAGQLVAAGLCSREDADGVLYERIYQPFGAVTAADVAELRRQIAAEAVYLANIDAGAAKWNAFVAAMDAWRDGGFAGEAPGGL